MQIEIHAPQGQVKEWLIDFVKEQLIQLHQKDKDISRAQVYFREQDDGLIKDKVCAMDLSIYGDSLSIHRKAASYEQAVREVLASLKEKIDVQLQKQNEPPGELTSTVKI